MYNYFLYFEYKNLIYNNVIYIFSYKLLYIYIGYKKYYEKLILHILLNLIINIYVFYFILVMTLLKFEENSD